MIHPDAVWRPIDIDSTDRHIEPIGVVLHVDAGNASTLWHWWQSAGSQGIESHFHVRKDGTFDQYRDTDIDADANRYGNAFTLDVDLPEMGLKAGTRVGFLSIETQGYASGEWTQEQLDTLKKLIVDLSEEHGFPIRVAPAWNRPGIGYHVMWGAPGAWTPVAGKVCPGPDRIKQFKDIIVPWMEGENMFTTKEEAELKSFLKFLSDMNSNVSFVQYLIPDMRKGIITLDELQQALDEAEANETVDAFARRLAAKANARLDAIKGAI